MRGEPYGEYDWSKWYPFNDGKILASLPNKPGIYEVRTDFEIGRLCGSSSLVTIGRAKNIAERRGKQKAGDIIRYLNRPEKWLFKNKHELEFRYCICDSFEEAKYLEGIRQLEYESQHWELPPGNDRLEISPLKSRIEELFGCTAEQMVNDVLQGKLNVTQVTSKLHISQTILNTLIIYWGKTAPKRMI